MTDNRPEAFKLGKARSFAFVAPEIERRSGNSFSTVRSQITEELLETIVLSQSGGQSVVILYTRPAIRLTLLLHTVRTVSTSRVSSVPLVSPDRLKLCAMSATTLKAICFRIQARQNNLGLIH